MTVFILAMLVFCGLSSYAVTVQTSSAVNSILNLNTPDNDDDKEDKGGSGTHCN